MVGYLRIQEENDSRTELVGSMDAIINLIAVGQLHGQRIHRAARLSIPA
jgi:hypothetical protein